MSYDVSSGLSDVLLSTSALFTLVLASVFPATSNDRFTLSKFVAVTLRFVSLVVAVAIAVAVAVVEMACVCHDICILAESKTELDDIFKVFNDVLTEHS